MPTITRTSTSSPAAPPGVAAAARSSNREIQSSTASTARSTGPGSFCR